MQCTTVASSESRFSAPAAPPLSDTGAPITDRPSGSVSVCIDWLSFTLDADASWSDAFPWADPAILASARPLDRGGYGYPQCAVLGSVRLYYGGERRMGVHIVCSGDGVKELEQWGLRDWPGYLAYLLDRGAHISRLDVAWDDRAGVLRPVSEMVGYVRSGRVRTEYRSWSEIVSGRVLGEASGHTLYLGSSSSSSRVRIYDKAQEQGVDGHWIRVEWQARDEVAQAVAEVIVGEGIGQVAGYLAGHVAFVERGGANRSRWPLAGWWAAFLSHCGRSKLVVGRVARTIEGVRDWLERQVWPSVALVLLHLGGDWGEIQRCIAMGRTRLSARQLALLAT